MEVSTALVATPHELGRASDMFGINIDLASLFPESFGTVLQARIVIADGLPSAHSSLFLQRTNCLELFVFADRVKLFRSTSRVETRNAATSRRWNVVWSSVIVGVWEEAEVPATQGISAC